MQPIDIYDTKPGDIILENDSDCGQSIMKVLRTEDAEYFPKGVVVAVCLNTLYLHGLGYAANYNGRPQYFLLSRDKFFDQLQEYWNSIVKDRSFLA